MWLCFLRTYGESLMLEANYDSPLTCPLLNNLFKCKNLTFFFLIFVTYMHTRDNRCTWIFLGLFYYIALWVEHQNRSAAHFSPMNSLWVHKPLWIKQTAVSKKCRAETGRSHLLSSSQSCLPENLLHLSSCKIPVQRNQITILMLVVSHIMCYLRSFSTWAHLLKFYV